MVTRTLVLITIIVSAPVFAFPPGVDFSVWNNPLCSAQCHGDANCHGDVDWQGDLVRVTTEDMAMLIGLWPYCPVAYPNDNYDPRVDFDRNFRIDDGDKNIIEEWYEKPGCPADCAKKLALNFNQAHVLGGSTQTVHWDWNIFTDYIPLPPHQDQPGLIALYYQVAGSDWVLVGTINGARQLDWLVPNAAGQYRLRVIDQDHPGLMDISSFFDVYLCRLDPVLDTDHDCVITMKDFSALSTQWLFEPDGKTMDDLLMLANYWLACGNPYDSACITIP